MIIFLMGLLCLVSNDKLFSQRCFVMSYDRNGNRTHFAITDCFGSLRGGEENVDEGEGIYNNDQDDMSVYPNPNGGKFRIELKNDKKEDLLQMCIYDVRGTLVKSESFTESIDVDISDVASGTYILRITGADEVRNVIVVKL